MSGGSVQPNGLYLPRGQPLAGAGVAMNHRRYIAYTVARNGCSGGNLPPTGPQGRSRGTFEFVTLNAKNVCHSGLECKRSGGIFYVAEKYQHKVKSATWEDSATPFHNARNDISGVPFNLTGYICHGASPSPGLEWR